VFLNDVYLAVFLTVAIGFVALPFWFFAKKYRLSGSWVLTVEEVGILRKLVLMAVYVFVLIYTQISFNFPAELFIYGRF